MELFDGKTNHRTRGCHGNGSSLSSLYVIKTMHFVSFTAVIQYNAGPVQWKWRSTVLSQFTSPWRHYWFHYRGRSVAAIVFIIGEPVVGLILSTISDRQSRLETLALPCCCCWWCCCWCGTWSMKPGSTQKTFLTFIADWIFFDNGLQLLRWEQRLCNYVVCPQTVKRNHEFNLSTIMYPFHTIYLCACTHTHMSLCENSCRCNLLQCTFIKRSLSWKSEKIETEYLSRNLASFTFMF